VRWAIDDQGRRWVRKHVEQCGFEAVLAEAVGWLIARAIGVPVPDAAVSGAEDDLSWLSSWVSDATHWDPARAHLIGNVDEFGRMLALDAILFNEDRHARNMLLQAVDGTHVKLWAIDCDAALVGWPADFAKRAVADVPSTKNLAPGIPADLLAPGARAGAMAATALSGAALAAYVAEACDITGDPNGDVLTKALTARMASAVEVTENYLRALGVRP
jgi:hypothetical protein